MTLPQPFIANDGGVCKLLLILKLPFTEKTCASLGVNETCNSDFSPGCKEPEVGENVKQDTSLAWEEVKRAKDHSQGT